MNKKLELVLRTLVYDTVVPGGHWSSSAKDYQDFLTAQGIKLPIELFHKYKYPNNVTPQKFEEQLQTLVFFLTFDTRRIEKPREYAEWIISETERIARNDDAAPLTDKEKSELIRKYCDAVKNLSDAEKSQLVDYVKQQSESVVSQIVDLFMKTADLNPELMDINLDNASLYDFVEILDGVSYGYNPIDIKYYIENKNNLAQVRKEQNTEEFIRLVGKNPHVFIHPDRIRIMLDEIKKQKNLQRNIERGMDL